MTPEQYWLEDPWLVKYYREAYKIRKDEINTRLWLGGLYNLKAFEAIMQNAFGDKKGKYPEKPFDLEAHEETPEEIRERIYNQFARFEEMFNEHSSD